MVKQLQGAFPILTTPCDKNGDLDLKSLRNEVEWCIENGVHGLFLGNCSELYAYGPAERHRITEAVIDAANGKVPVVAGGFASNSSEAADLSKDAQDLGADAIFTYGHYIIYDDSADIVEYYRRIDRAVDIPIVAYDTDVGAPKIMPPETLFKIAEVPGVEYMKMGENTMAQYRRAVESGIGEKVKLLCGNSNLNFRFLMTYPKAVGFTACLASVLPAEHADMWNYFKKGDYDKARETWYRRILPLLELMSIGGAGNIRKEALYQMGIIKSPAPKKPYSTRVCDDFHQKELRAVLKLLGKL